MDEPKWLQIARGEVGVHEVRGGENPRILEYDTATALCAKEDEVPWCAAFCCWCIEQAGLHSPRSARAADFLTWGMLIPQPVLGCVTVIKAKATGGDAATGSASGYHVAFWLGEDDDQATLLGGNQSDQVKVSRFPKAAYRVEGYRLPWAT